MSKPHILHLSLLYYYIIPFQHYLKHQLNLLLKYLFLYHVYKQELACYSVDHE